MTIFISGTYSDLKEYHQAVVDILHKLRADPRDMIYFPASDARPASSSIEELRQCDFYIGIIGHRYGTVPEGEDRSITRIEYDFAVAAQLVNARPKHLLIFLADENDVRVSQSFAEPLEQSKKQREFRQYLASRHSTILFKNPNHLAQEVLAALYRHSQHTSSAKQHRVFDVDQEQLIREEFDSSSQDRALTIERFMSFVVKKFADIFDLKRGSIDIHPFFKELRKELNERIPGISLDPKQGELVRSNVRHVVLRVATLQKILTEMPRDHLMSLGKKIGQSAASDLMEHTIEAKGLIPKSSRALITLWDFWDRTGGWGKFSLENNEEAGELNAPDAWRIRVTNNCFVDEGRPGQPNEHRLCDFRRGYIHGFLDVALKRLTEIIFALEPSEKSQVTLPEYARVDKVEHVSDDQQNVDFFVVTFKREKLSDALQHLRLAQEELKKQRYPSCVLLAQDAISSARSVLGDQFDEWIRDSDLDPATLSELSPFSNMKSHGMDPVDAESAKRKFDAANLIIQGLANATGIN